MHREIVIVIVKQFYVEFSAENIRYKRFFFTYFHKTCTLGQHAQNVVMKHLKINLHFSQKSLIFPKVIGFAY